MQISADLRRPHNRAPGLTTVGYICVPQGHMTRGLLIVPDLAHARGRDCGADAGPGPSLGERPRAPRAPRRRPPCSAARDVATPIGHRCSSAPCLLTAKKKLLLRARTMATYTGCWLSVRHLVSPESAPQSGTRVRGSCH